MKTNKNPTYQIFLSLLSLASCLVISDGRPLGSSMSTLITEACSQSAKKDLCEKIINSDHTNPRNNLNDIAFIAFDQTDKAATSSIEFISQAAVSQTASNDVAQAAVNKAFQICDKEYERASDAIDNAISALSSRTKGDETENFLKEASTAIETCQASTKGHTGKALQLDHINQHLLDLLKNALAVFHVYLEHN